MRSSRRTFEVIIMRYEKEHKMIAASGSGPEEEHGERRACPLLRGSEKGIALVVVLVLAAISLTLMTTLIYMISVGTQSSGLLKRYKTALEAGYASADIVAMVIAVQEKSNDNTTFSTNFDALKSNLNAFNMNPSVSSVMSGCTGSTKEGAVYSGIAAKIMTPQTSWSGCNDSLDLNPADDTTYDMKFDVGTDPRYTVYAKIVNTIQGNTGGGDLGLLGKPVVSSGGELPVMPLSSNYTIEVDAESTAANSSERVKLQILYQY